MNEVAGLPYDAELEKAQLGRLLMEPTLLDELDHTPEDFFLERHKAVYEGMQSLWQQGSSVDYVLLSDELGRLGKLDIVGGLGSLIDLVNAVPSALGAQHYGQRLRRYAQLRDITALNCEAQRMIHDGKDVDEILAYHRDTMRKIETGARKDSDIMSFEDSHLYTETMLAGFRNGKAEALAGWRWPWESWNNLIDPAERGALIVFAGQEGTGKTAYAEALAEHWAVNGAKVGFAHFELNRDVMMQRRLCRWAKVDRRTLTAQRKSTEDVAKIERAVQAIQEIRGSIDYLHCPGWSIEEVCREARVRKWDALIVDYMQMAGISKRQMSLYRTNHNLRKADDAAQLKNLSESEEIRTVVLNQYNKANKDIRFSELSSANLRDTGEIADKASVVILAHRERLTSVQKDTYGKVVGMPGDWSRVVRLRVDKNTLGAQGVIEMVVKGEHFTVRDKSAV
jgi:replicative DNA helicase